MVKTVRDGRRAPELASAHWALGETSFRRLDVNPQSVAWRLETGTGAYLLKRHRPGATAASLALQAQATAALAEGGFALTPPPVAAADGSVYLDCEGALHTLTRFVDADQRFDWTQPAWTDAHRRAAGAALASLHNCGQAVAAGLPALPPSPYPSLSGWLAESLSAAARLQASADQGSWLAEIVAGSDLAGGRCAAACARAAGESHQRTLAHGDYHPGNVLFRKAAGSPGQPVVAAVLDLDHLHCGSPLMDLGYAAIFFCAAWEGMHAVDETAAAALIAGYLEGCADGSLADRLASLPLNEALRPHIELACLLCLYWLIDRYIEGISCGQQSAAAGLIGPIEHIWRTMSSIPYNPD